jgi:hypothetical protein
MLTESETIESTSAWEWWTSPLASSGRRSRSLRALAIASMLPHRAGDEAPPPRAAGRAAARSPDQSAHLPYVRIADSTSARRGSGTG